MESTQNLPGELQSYSGNLTIHQILKSHEDASFVLSSYGLTGCTSCKINEKETLAEACQSYRIPLDPLLDSLNNLLD